MLNPSMQELMKRVGNRYLLVNLAAQRARILPMRQRKRASRCRTRLLSWARRDRSRQDRLPSGSACGDCHSAEQCHCSRYG
ncbi:MAG: DNA-directed RNA polymerase subunit omega [Butyricicoccaceae bacterium]